MILKHFLVSICMLFCFTFIIECSETSNKRIKTSRNKIAEIILAFYRNNIKLDSVSEFFNTFQQNEIEKVYDFIKKYTTFSPAAREVFSEISISSPYSARQIISETSLPYNYFNLRNKVLAMIDSPSLHETFNFQGLPNELQSLMLRFCNVKLLSRFLMTSSATYKEPRAIDFINSNIMTLLAIKRSKSLKTMPCLHSKDITYVALSPNDDYFVTGSRDATAKKWDPLTGKCLYTLAGHTDSIRMVSINKTGNIIVTASNDGSVKLWDAGSGECLQTFYGLKQYVLSAGISCDDNYVFAGDSQGTVILWNRAGQIMKKYSLAKGRITKITMSNNNEYIIALNSMSQDVSLVCWNLANDEQITNHVINNNMIVTLNPFEKKYSKPTTESLLIQSDNPKKSMKIEFTKEYLPENGTLVTNSDENIVFVKQQPEKNELFSIQASNGKHIAISKNNRFMITITGNTATILTV